jgi:hypothetical protein
VVGPERTPSVHLYFLRKKGFVFRGLKGLAPQEGSEPPLAVMIRKGAAYLYLADPRVADQEWVRPYLGELVLKEGGFEVHRLRAPRGGRP